MALLPANVVGRPRLQLAPEILVGAGNVLLVGAWLWLSRHTFAWLARCFADPGARTNALLLSVALLVLMVRALPGLQLRAVVIAQPRTQPVALGLFVLCALAQTMKGLLLGSNMLACISVVVGTHALAGLYLPRATWRRGWIAVFVAVALLPFGPHIDAFLGFPARVATAHLVQSLLGASGVMVQSAEAILIFENGVASIDLPCSGVKGLWVGGIFFLALTWLERRDLGWRWLMAGGAFLAALAVANFLRVLLLVLIGFAWGKPAIATLVHLPLGVFGFVMACGLAVLLIRRLPARGTDVLAREPTGRPLRLGTAALIGLLLCLAALPTSRARERVLASADLRLPKAWGISAVPLEDKESRLFEQHGAVVAGKWRFRAGDSQGSLLVVVADSFRAHHAPEVCLASSGHKIDGIRREFLGPGLPIKLIDTDGHRASAAAWFQSASTTTDSLMGRTLGEFLHGQRRWALVSVLFDQPTTFDSATSALLQQLHAAVGRSLVPSSKGP